MANYICPVLPPSIWFPVDPGIVELPAAPPVVVNPSSEPANTAPGTYTEADFIFDTEDYGYVRGQTCYVVDYGFITSGVTATADYGGLLTIWNSLPTNTPAVPAREVDTTTIYPPYKEIVVEIFTAFTAIEVTGVQKVTVELDLPIVVKTTANIYKLVKVTDIIGVVRTQCTVAQLGGYVPLPTRTTVEVTSVVGVLAVGMEYGFVLEQPGGDVLLGVRTSVEVTAAAGVLYAGMEYGYS